MKILECYIKFLKFINKKIDEIIFKCEKNLIREIIVIIKHDTINGKIIVNLCENIESVRYYLTEVYKIRITVERETIDYGEKMEFEFEECKYIIYKRSIFDHRMWENE